MGGLGIDVEFAYAGVFDEEQEAGGYELLHRVGRERGEGGDETYAPFVDGPA
jgi:hypothetical protein